MNPQNDSPNGILKACPVCGIRTGQTLVFEKWGYSILACKRCGLGSTAIPDSFDPTSLYTRDYFQGKARDGYADYLSSEPVLRKEFRHLVAHLRRCGPATGRLLEIGCAYGFFLSEARPYYHCTGIDVALDAVNFADARGLDVHHGVADEQFLMRTGPFDVVVMLDVIEHLADPAVVLAAVSAALTAGGCLVITTGDWGSRTARLAGRHWRLMTPPQHLNFFSRSTLSSLLKRVGLEVIDCHSPWKFVPVGLAAYQFARRLGVTVPLPSILNRLGLPVNLFDTMRVVARKT